MKILIINTTFDFKSPNTICVKEIIKECETRGHECMVVTKYGTAYKTNVSGYVDIKENSFLLKSKLGYRIAILLSFFTWPRILFQNLSIFKKKVKTAIEEFSPECLIAYCNSYESLYVASRMKGMYGNRFKYLAYFLDSIYAGPVPTMMTEKRRDRLALRAEHRVLSNADSIIMMKAAENKYLHNQAQIKYFKKISFLDIPLFCPKKLKTNHRTLFPEGQLICLFAGSMPYNIRSPRYLLNLISNIQIDNLQFYFAGSSDYMTELQSLEANNSNIHILGQLKHEEVMRYISEADVLINIGNNLKGMVPCKIFEYMSTGKPIITTQKIDDDPCIRYYEKYDQCLVIDESRSIDVSKKSFEEFLLNIDNNRDTKIDYSSMYLNTPKAFVDSIEVL